MCYGMFFGFVLDIILIAVFASKLRMDFRHIILNRPAIMEAVPGSTA
jgi:hypothetical protein